MLSAKDIQKIKGIGKITMLTAYDHSFSRLLDNCALDMLLVGDSLANVVLGMKETRKVSAREMLNHTAAVAGACQNTLVVADMPYLSYQKNPAKCLDYARRFIKAGAGAVKIEWFAKAEQVVKKIIKGGIPVMGHIGLTPQTAHLLGGYKVQGKDVESARRLVEQAKILEGLGCFSLVLECVPAGLAKEITAKVKIPTIGIGAGSDCDGQVLVLYDMLGLYTAKKMKFARQYADLAAIVQSAAQKFKADVSAGRFPSAEESF